MGTSRVTALGDYRAWLACSFGFALLPLLLQLVLGSRLPVFHGEALLSEILLPAFVLTTSAIYEYLRPDVPRFESYAAYLALLILAALFSIGAYVVFSVPAQMSNDGSGAMTSAPSRGVAAAVTPWLPYASTCLVALMLSGLAARLVYLAAAAKTARDDV